MCLSTVYVRSGNERKEVMRDVARIEADGHGFWLIDLLGRKEFVGGSIKVVDLMDEHVIVLERA